MKKLLRIEQVAEKLGLDKDAIENYGNCKAKVSLNAIKKNRKSNFKK